MQNSVYRTPYKQRNVNTIDDDDNDDNNNNNKFNCKWAVARWQWL